MKLKLFLATVIMFCLTPILSVHAQDEYPHGEVYGGYSFANVGASTSFFGSSYGLGNINSPLGFQVEAEGNVNKWFGIDGGVSYNTKSVNYNYNSFGYNYGSSTATGSITIVTVGPRFTLRYGRTSIFGHTFIGSMSVSGAFDGYAGSESAFAYGAGGGIDVDLTKHLAIRTVQADYVTASKFGVRVNAVRVSSGLIFHF